jgi:DNA-binding transcriptional MocR family regulator
MLSQRPYESLIGPDHRRFALVRSVSKFLGPDMCLAIAATDATTAERLAMRLSPGTTWVSHLLQRLTLTQLTDASVTAKIADAREHYASRNAAFASRLREEGLDSPVTDGLSLWIALPKPARLVAEKLMRRGWLARTGDDFALDERADPSHHLRLTVHDLSDEDAETLIADLVAATR